MGDMKIDESCYATMLSQADRCNDEEGFAV